MTGTDADGGTIDRRETISYQLRRAQDASFRVFAALTGGHGLRPGRYTVLQAIAQTPGLSQSRLGAMIGRDKTTLTPILQDMQRAGLIRRDRDPVDRRSRCLLLTESGEAMLATLHRHAMKHDERLAEILGEPDRRELVRLLRTLSDALEE